MCGILGCFEKTNRINGEILFSNALDTIIHRGPNDKGCEIINFFDHQSRLIIGQTRLSIIDLSFAGHQPMYSLDRRYIISFNGEIYNYKELRNELSSSGIIFHTETDTEVLLNAWIKWGSESLKRFVGMFAFAICDIQEKKLFLARDAFGIKPLYFLSENDLFAFASEIPALLKIAPNSLKINQQTSIDYLISGRYDNTDKTFFTGIQSISAGHFLEIEFNNFNTIEHFVPKRWWWPSIKENKSIKYEDAVEQLREIFLDNIKLHLRSDVPLGAALSGGIDSSSVVCAMRKIAKDKPINTFSYIASDSNISEEYWVDYVNNYVNAKPHKVIVESSEMLSDLDDMILVQGEPFGSTSIYAQYRVFKLAKDTGITVTLDGQGADELLAGYSGYPHARIQSLLQKGNFIELTSFLNQWSKWPGRSQSQAFRHLISQITPNNFKKIYSNNKRSNFPSWINQEYLSQKAIKVDFLNDCPQYFDSYGRQLMNILRDSLCNGTMQNLLRHGDRNSMKWNIESRVPFLTHNMAEFLLSLPENYLLSNRGETKSIFRSAMRGIVPDEILDRKDKIGFSTPERHWFQHIDQKLLKQWLEPLCSMAFVRPDQLLKEISDQISGKSPKWDVWRLINFSKWSKVFNTKL